MKTHLLAGHALMLTAVTACVSDQAPHPEWQPVSMAAHQVSTHVAIESFHQRCKGELRIHLPEGVSARLLGTPGSDGPIRDGRTSIRVPPADPIDLEFRLTMSRKTAEGAWDKMLERTEFVCDPQGSAEWLPVVVKSISAYLKYEGLCEYGMPVALAIAPALTDVEIEPDLKDSQRVVRAVAGTEEDLQVPGGATDARLTFGAGEAAPPLTATNLLPTCDGEPGYR